MSWTCTVPKVQGLSLAQGLLSSDLEKQKPFNQGQIYAALSRIPSMNKMYWIGSYNKTPLKVNESAKKEYERLRREGLFKSQSHFAVTKTSVTKTLLNTRSLKLHVPDIPIDECMIIYDNDNECMIMIYYVHQKHN